MFNRDAPSTHVALAKAGLFSFLACVCAFPADAQADPFIEYFPRPTKAERKIFEALEQPTSVEFLDTPFEDCMQSLKEYHKINIWIDRETLTDDGVALDQRVTLKLAGVTLKSILKLLLEPLRLTYVIEDDVMKITTWGCEGLITRTYPVGDLYEGRIPYQEPPLDAQDAPGRPRSQSRPGDLETAILKTIDPSSWDENHGPASMTYIRRADCLVIHQTVSVHKQILQLLRDLREAKRAGQSAVPAQASLRTGWTLKGPRRGDTYSIVGIMDLDGDGEDDSARLRRVIKASGGSVDNEVDERGMLSVDGRYPDDGKPRVTDKTKFVIVGKIPQPAELSDPKEIAVGLKIAAYYKDIEDQARVHGVRIVGLEDFLRYIGYEPMESQTARP